MADDSYLIDIAARMPEGERTIAELDALTEKLMGGGKDADIFSTALSKVDARLRAAKESSLAASAALAEGSAEYARLESAADRAARTVERRGAKATREQIEAALQAKAALDAYGAELKQLETAAEQAADAEKHLAKQHVNIGKLSKHVEDTLGDAATKTSTFRGALGDIGGPIGELGEALLKPRQAFVDLNEQFGRGPALATLAVFGYARVATTLITLAAAGGLALAAVLALAVGVQDATRTEELHLAAIEAQTPALRAATGEYYALERETGQSAEQLEALSRSLLDAKVAAEDMPAALRAAATAEAALGSGGSAEFLKNIRAGKDSVGELASEVQSKFGGIVEQRMLSLDMQGARLKKNLAGLFEDLDIEPVLLALEKFVGMFDETHAVGRAVRELLGGIFQPLIDNADKVYTVIEAFVLGALIALTKLYLNVRDLFGFEDTSLEDTLASAETAGRVLVVTAGALIFTLGVLAAAVLAIPLALVALGIGIAEALMWLGDLGAAGWDAAGDLLDGLVDGIYKGGSRFVDAVKDLASRAIKTAKEVLGIASPSKEFAEIGHYTGEGFIEGIDDMAPAANDAMGRMVEPPEVTSPVAAMASLDSGGASSARPSGSTSGGTAAGGGAAGGPVVDLRYAQIIFQGLPGAEAAVPAFGEALTEWLEGNAERIAGRKAS